MVQVAASTRNRVDCRGVQTKFTVTDYTENVTVTCDGLSNDQLSDILGTVIKQLIEQGILNGTVDT